MSFNWPHMLVTVLLIFLVLQVLERIEAYRNASGGKKFLMLIVPLFVVIFVLNLVWPYSN